ncbi:hypothetical protein GP486_001113 [Trichoglossum hirsutum]|uniref:Bud22 domain-containing protein n=1 Tax=Trichoglossum hirsutum TaxID=265104 RepID=A0A9P8RTE5_9PEZI|nr:hypothetical protein GP486_001113 [Trichoglossum hirsutum]
MPKRKQPHSELKAIDGNLEAFPGRALDIQERQIEQKIAIGKKALNRALKLAKGFERRKLGRRLKAAGAEGHVADVMRLTSEIESLKLQMLAEAHIYKTLARSKPVSSSSAFLQRISNAVKATQTDRKTLQDRVENNVVARLYNSNPVKEVTADILKAIQASLGPEATGEYGYQRVQKTQKDDQVQASSPEYLASNGGLASEDMDTIVASGVGDKGRQPFDRATNASSSEDEQTGISKYENRVVDVKDEGSDSCHSSVEDDSKEVAQGHDEMILDPKANLSLSLSPLPSESSSAPPPLGLRKQKKSLTTPISTFLPSLMGGYWSGSESAEDESAGQQLRKNRMGQRARRQLWEKKFGMKANHLRDTARDKGWDPKRGARTVGDRRESKSARNSVRSADAEMKYSRREDRASGGGPRSVNVSEGPLHPSWEAAKKAKRQATQATFLGKKITFD